MANERSADKRRGRLPQRLQRACNADDDLRAGKREKEIRNERRCVDDAKADLAESAMSHLRGDIALEVVTDKGVGGLSQTVSQKRRR